MSWSIAIIILIGMALMPLLLGKLSKPWKNFNGKLEDTKNSEKPSKLIRLTFSGLLFALVIFLGSEFLNYAVNTTVVILTFVFGFLVRWFYMDKEENEIIEKLEDPVIDWLRGDNDE